MNFNENSTNKLHKFSYRDRSEDKFTIFYDKWNLSGMEIEWDWYNATNNRRLLQTKQRRKIHLELIE